MSRSDMVFEVYRLCNAFGWFTHGTNTQYERMFQMVREGKPIHDIALAIWLCSDGEELETIETNLEDVWEIKRKGGVIMEISRTGIRQTTGS